MARKRPVEIDEVQPFAALARERARRIEYLERESLTLTDKIAKLEADPALQPSAGRELTITGPGMGSGTGPGTGSGSRSGTTGV